MPWEDDPEAAVQTVGSAGPRHRTFRAEHLDASLDRLGFQVVDLLSADQLDQVRAVRRSVGPAPGDPQTGFFPGNNASSAEWKQAVLDAVGPLVAGRVEELFDDHVVYHLSFLTKWPGPQGDFVPHRDPTMLWDEERWRGVTAWCPIDDLDVADRRQRGPLHVVPGSHRLPADDASGLRRYDPGHLAEVADDIRTSFGQVVDLHPGQAVVFDHRLVHYSPPNRSAEPRIVLALALRPAGATNVHIEHADGVVEAFDVDDAYFLSDRSAVAAHHPRRWRSPRQPVAPISRRDLERITQEAGLPLPSPLERRRAPKPQRRSTAAPGVLADAQLDRRLGRDGFVHVPGLLDPAVATDLRSTYGEVHGWNGTGFEVDFWSPDADYRQTASEAIAAAADAAIDRLFVGQRVLLRNFLVKWPGDADDGAFPKAPHLDWMYTDERDGVRSWVVWIALEDITGDNGQLRVARGSHRLDAGLRGMNLEAPWLDHTEVWERRLLAIPARCGDAVITDAALVHSSFPNLTDVPRVAVAIAVAPRGAQLVHHRRIDATTAARYEVDESFFLEQEITQLKDVGPPRPIADLAEVGGMDLSPAALARQLDRQPLALVDHGRRALTSARRGVATWPDRARALRQRAVDPEQGGPVRWWADRSLLVVHAKVAVAGRLLALHHALLRRAHRARGGLWDAAELPWSRDLEAEWPRIRAEVDGLLGGDPLPLIEDVTGSHQGNSGTWRTFVLLHEGQLVAGQAERCPVTSAAVAAVPGATSAGFSLLEPGTHIPEHRGPVDGILRYHLGVVVPAPSGSARLRVAGQEVTWQEGRSLLFDDAAPHEAWNDATSDRVALVMDVDVPVPWYLRPTARLARRIAASDATTRSMADNLHGAEPS